VTKLSFAEIIRSGLKPEEVVIQLPNLAILVMGLSGIGKTYFLGTAEKPLLVQQFDPPSKSDTYENLGFLPSSLESTQWGDVQHYFSAKQPDRWIIRVEYFDEPNPRSARAISNFMGRMNSIEKDIREWGVRTVGLDCLTSMETAARWYNKYSFHPSNKEGKEVADERIHYGASARIIEEYAFGRYPGLQRLCNVVLLAHVKNAKDDEAGPDEDQNEMRKTLAAPGQQAWKIPSGLSEVYRLYRDEKGNRWLQTDARPTNTFECKSIRGLKDPTQAHWRAITTQLEERYAKRLAELTRKEKKDGE
jgi:hypothetical protein